MSRAQQITIRGAEYSVTPLDCETGCLVGIRLAKSLGPAFDLADKVADKEAFGLEIIKRIPEVAKTIADDDFKFVFRNFCETTVVTTGEFTLSGREQLSKHFAAKYAAMLEWLQFCVRVNFPDLLSALGGNGAAPSASEKSARQ